jgi:phosphoribosyl 1,2-cyclic phosphate phosphodiesterase
MSDSEIELLFLGTGTSAGVPMIGCHCDVCRSADPRDRRNRASVVVSRGDRRVLVDTTPELRLQCVTHGVDRVDSVVYTHAHADHIMGLDDVRRFNSLRRGPLDVWADEGTFATLRTCFAYAFREPDPEQKLFRPHLTTARFARTSRSRSARCAGRRSRSCTATCRSWGSASAALLTAPT